MFKRLMVGAVLLAGATALGACSSGSSLSAPEQTTSSTQTPDYGAYSDCLGDKNKTATECQPLNPDPNSPSTKYLLCLEDKSKSLDDCKALDPSATPTPTWTTWTPTETPTSTPTPTLTTPTGPMENLAAGVVITVTITNNTTNAVVAVYTVTVKSVKYDASLGSNPNPGYVWVVVTATVKMQNGSKTISDKGFSIPASGGADIYPDTTVGSFPSSELTAGQSKTGDIGFQVPAGQHGVVQYYSNGKTASWKI